MLLYVLISLFLLPALGGKIETLLEWLDWLITNEEAIALCFCFLNEDKKNPITITNLKRFTCHFLPASSCTSQRNSGRLKSSSFSSVLWQQDTGLLLPPTASPTPTKHFNSALFPQLGLQKVTLNKERFGRSLQTTHTQRELHFVRIAKATPFSMQPPGAIHEAGSLRTESSSPDRLPLTSCGRVGRNAASA